MWPNRQLCDLLKIEHPIIMAPMSGATNPVMTAAVSSGGALGSLGAASIPPDTLRESIGRICSFTSKPYGVNLFVPDHERYITDEAREKKVCDLIQPYLDELGIKEPPKPKTMFGPFQKQVEVLLEERVPIFSFHLGIPPANILKSFKRNGTIVLGTATTVSEARALDQAGVDVVIAQGAEAGGHRGTFDGPWQQSLIGGIALIPQVVDAVSVPVVAAGGIMDGRGIAAAMALGASGVQMGTAFLAVHESPIAEAWRHRVLNCTEQDTVITTVISGRPARGFRTRYIEEMTSHADQLLPFSAQYSLFNHLRAVAAENNNPDFLAMWAGQGAPLTRFASAADIIATLIEESAEQFSRMGSASP